MIRIAFVGAGSVEFTKDLRGGRARRHVPVRSPTGSPAYPARGHSPFWG